MNEVSAVNSPTITLQKIPKLVQYTPKNPYFGRHIKWLADFSPETGFISIVLKIIEISLLIVSVIGIPVVYTAYNYYTKVKSEKEFHEIVSKVPSPDKKKIIQFKSHRKSFNQTHEFIIERDYLWTRIRGSSDEWKPIYFEGKKPIELSCDGANLIVLDSDRNVHYKKVLREYQYNELSPKERERLSIPYQDSDVTISVDKSTRNNWKTQWFSLPFLHYIVNLFISKRLLLPNEILDWGISHRGIYNNFLEDGYNKHTTRVGCTTLKTLDKTGKLIILYDPWSPKHALTLIPLPETTLITFEAIKMVPSASTIMVIGYERKKNDSFETLHIKTRIADIDAQGWNPIMKYDYIHHADDPEVMVIPLPSWKEHALPQAVLEGKAQITNKIMIMQTGEGNDARRLVVKGVNENGDWGYFFKGIAEEDWKFHKKISNLKRKNHDYLPIRQETNKPFTTTVKNYTCSQSSIKSNSPFTIKLKNFDLHRDRSTIEIDIAGNTFELLLILKKTLLNFLGFEGNSYHLVIPPDLRSNVLINQLFYGKQVIPLQATIKNDVVEFYGKENIRCPLFLFKVDIN